MSETTAWCQTCKSIQPITPRSVICKTCGNKIFRDAAQKKHDELIDKIIDKMVESRINDAESCTSYEEEFRSLIKIAFTENQQMNFNLWSVQELEDYYSEITKTKGV